MIFEYLASYCTSHFRHLLWKVSAVCAFLTLLGKLFHIRHPEYLILCLKHSFFGSGGTKHPAAVDPPLKKLSGSAHVSRRKNMKVKKENMPIMLYSLQIFTSSGGIVFSVISQCRYKI